MPKPRYGRIRIGESSSKSRLDGILAEISVPFEHYMFFVKATQVEDKKFGTAEAEVFLILTIDSVVILKRQGENFVTLRDGGWI